MVARYNGQNGNVICKASPVMAYNMKTSLATQHNAFYATFFAFGWRTQYVVKLDCSKTEEILS